MSKNAILTMFTLILFLLLVDGFFISRHKNTLTIVQAVPVRGSILRYEDFKGCKVPIKADGSGGEYRWIADVPWDKFTIEEKFDMARVNGGLLSKKDIKELWHKYGDMREGKIK